MATSPSPYPTGPILLTLNQEEQQWLRPQIQDAVAQSWPEARRHYVSHIPMDHTAIIKFVEDLFIGNGKYLTARDAAQPNLLDFFDFKNTPWAAPPTPPVPVSQSSFSSNPCNPSTM